MTAADGHADRDGRKDHEAPSYRDTVTVAAEPEPRSGLHWPRRRLAAAGLAMVMFGLAVGVPTGVIPTPLYTRMTPVLWWNYGVWAATAALGGLVVATYIRRPGDEAPQNGVAAASGGGLLAAFAVGCPVCNKIVVAALGVSGALSIWGPLQPVIAVASIAALGWTLRSRLRSEYACPIGTRQPLRTPHHPSDEPLCR